MQVTNRVLKQTEKINPLGCQDGLPTLTRNLTTARECSAPFSKSFKTASNSANADVVIFELGARVTSKHITIYIAEKS